jgi:hypothetical protein
VSTVRRELVGIVCLLASSPWIAATSLLAGTGVLLLASGIVLQIAAREPRAQKLAIGLQPTHDGALVTARMTW